MSHPTQSVPLPATPSDLEVPLAKAGVAFRHMVATAASTLEFSEEVRNPLKGLGYFRE